MADGTVLIIVAVLGVAGAWGSAFIANRRVKDTQQQVSTSNGLTIGELAESNHKMLGKLTARVDEITDKVGDLHEARDDIENYQRELFLGMVEHLSDHLRQEHGIEREENK